MGIYIREMSLKGKTCVITAAGQGIGRATAELFHNEGATVYASDINAEALKQLPEGINTAVLDVTNSAAVKEYCNQLEKVDVLFNVAGWVPHGSVLDSTEEEWNKCMDLNVTSMFRMAQGVLPLMLKAGSGSIINMSSVASSRKGVPLRCAYSTSKAAVIGLTKSIAADYITKGIRCNAILPGTVDTPSFRGRVAGTKGMSEDEAMKMFTARQPTGRFCSKEEVANLALYLASDESSYTTGGEHIIDGGWSL